MAATSPYTPNDYAAVSNFRPYELPINDIFKGISAQNAFWDAGAARVKSVYDNALNLKLSLEPNKEIRRLYMEDAAKQLTKLSSMDLSDPSVQRQGFSLFKPLFQDEGIIYDDLATRHYDKVRNDALMYRSKDNGKGYSDINMRYALEGYNEFVSSRDRMAGKKAYESRREYTPYYDYTEDFSNALKDCKPSSVEVQSPYYGSSGNMTGYMKESYSKSLSAEQTRVCLEAGLSPNAARQLQIEGSVSYRNNPEVLAADTASYLSGVGTNLSAKLEQLSAKKAALANRKDLSKEEMAVVTSQLDDQMKGLTQELDRTNRSVQKLNAGDITDVLNNFDQYAGSVYSYKKLYKKALASQFEERRELYQADPVQLNSIRFSQEKYLRALDFNYDVSLEGMKQGFQREMALLDLTYGNNKQGTSGADVYRNPLTGEITVNPNLLRETANLRDTPTADPKIYEKLTGQVGELNGQDQNNNLRLYNNLISRAERDKGFRETLLKGFNFGITDDEWIRFKNQSKNNRFNISREGDRIGGLQETSWFKAYVAEQPDDEDVNKWSTEYMIVQAGLGTLNRKIELAEKQVSDELGGNLQEQINSALSRIKPVNTTFGQLTSQEIKNAVDGKPGRLVITRSTPRAAGSAGIGSIGGPSEMIFTLDGRELQGSDRAAVVSAYTKIQENTGTSIKKLNDKRVEVYNKLGFDREPWYFTPNDKAPLVQTIKSILPKDDKGKEMDISIISSDFSGGVKVSVPGSKKGDETFPTLFRNAGIGTSAEATEDNIITLRGTNYNVVNQAIDNPVLGQAAYQLASIGETRSFAQTQDGAKVQNADIKIPALVSGKMREVTIETYKNGSSPEFRLYVEGANTSKPLAIASNAYELFEKIGRLPIDLNKPLNNGR